MSMRTVKKGEFLYNEGDKILNVYLIQSGAVNLCLARNKKTVDMFQVGVSQILGEQVLLGQNTFTTAALATTETKVLEIPVEAFKQQFETAQQMYKIIIKSLTERVKMTMAEVRSNRMEKDATPCPDDMTAKVFGSVFHTMNHKGEKKDDRVTIDWGLYRQYSQRVFGESLKRLEQATNLLVKLKLAMYEMGKDPDDPEGPEMIQKLHVFDLAAIENFFEFFQYYYFKGGGKSEILKVDESVVNILGAFLKLAETATPDRYGMVSLEFPKIVEYCKNELSINFTMDSLTRMETKGLFAKRKTSATHDVTLQFEVKEFTGFYKNWRIIREIEKWNEKGFVDPNEPEKKPVKKAVGGATCPSCAATIVEGQKFCGECGHKLATAA